jgi:8-oxo-dGTP diphosphatase
MGKTELINKKHIEARQKMQFGVSVDCVIFGFDENELKVLLIRCDMEPYVGMWSLVGEMVDQIETLDEAASRILYNQTGLSNVFLQQVHTFSKIDRHPTGRVVSVAYYSLVKIDDFILNPDNGNNEAHWHDLNEINHLAFDHRDILDTCLSKLRRQVREEPVGFELLPEKFTLSQLQNLYERILGIDLDKRNFRKKILKMKLITDLDEYQTNVPHRPAKLFSFNQERYEQLSDNGLIFDL